MANPVFPHKRDPNEPRLPLGDSKSEVLYIIAGIVILAIIAFAFWFESGR